MKLAAPKINANGTTNTSAVEQDDESLASGASSAPATDAAAKRMTYHSTLSHTLRKLDINSETKYHDLRNEDLKDLHELGQGNGGSVKKVEHLPPGTIMAKKVRDTRRRLRLR